MDSSLILSKVTFIYCFSGVMYISAWIFDKKILAKLGLYSLLVAAIGNCLGFGLRWKETYAGEYGHIPLSNLYESLIFFALTIVMISIFIEWKYKNYIINAFAVPMAFLCLAYASLSPGLQSQAIIQPLIPALKSNWLTAHVVTCFLGYAGFATAFATSILYLIKTSNIKVPLKNKLPEPGLLDEITQQTIMFGFLFLTIGIITGSVWANSAWGSYWSWDPKETWSLITWLIYAGLLHLRLMRGWGGKEIAIVSIFGFMAVLFTYFGVNYLPGLHSYAK